MTLKTGLISGKTIQKVLRFYNSEDGFQNLYTPSKKWNEEGKHTIIHIDSRPAHINKLFQPETEVIGDISYSLQQIQYRCEPKTEPLEFLKLKQEN